MINKSRAELLSGAPDAPPIDDLRNLFQLCPNHHTSFDRYEWTLVEERRSEDGAGFWLRHTCASATQRRPVGPHADFHSLPRAEPTRLLVPAQTARSFPRALPRVRAAVCRVGHMGTLQWASHFFSLFPIFLLLTRTRPSPSLSLSRLVRRVAFYGAHTILVLLSRFVPLCLTR